MSKVVLDASAVLAMLLLEPGGDVIAGRITNAHISVVNLAEVIAKLMDRGMSFDKALAAVEMLNMTVEVTDKAQAYSASALHSPTRPHGLSLGDRFCLALAAKMGAPVITTDKAWKKLDLGVEVIVAR